MSQFGYVRLYADEAGESHFEEVQATFDGELNAPPAPPLPLAAIGPASAVTVLSADDEWDGAAFHATPMRQLLVGLAGEFQLVASDGEARRFGPGDMVMLEDTSGRGHRTLVEGGGTALAVRMS